MPLSDESAHQIIHKVGKFICVSALYFGLSESFKAFEFGQKNPHLVNSGCILAFLCSAVTREW
jgi:hypothetical protein